MDTNRPTGPTGSPATLTPATSPDTRRRFHRQALKILDLLRLRPVWNYEMAQIALSYTAGRCAAWDDTPCGLLPAIYRPHTEAATEWIKGFNEGYAERMSLAAQL